MQMCTQYTSKEEHTQSNQWGYSESQQRKMEVRENPPNISNVFSSKAIPETTFSFQFYYP